MPAPNRLAYDMACVAVTLADIFTRIATIQARKAAGNLALKRDWYGHEIGVKETSGLQNASSAESALGTSAATSSTQLRKDQPATPAASPSRPAIPPIFKSFSKDAFDVPPLQPHPKIDTAPSAPPQTTSLPPSAPPDVIPNVSEAPELKVVLDPTPLPLARLSETSTGYPSQNLPPLPELKDERPPVVMRASKVPSTALGRLFHYGSLAAGLTTGAATEFVRRQTSSEPQSQSVMMSEANVTRLVNKLSQMRGAALKLGQFMSIQDAHVLPEQIEQILRRVQNAAHYMPQWQMEKVMAEELGENWKSMFEDFDLIPIASASIGQVHRATLSPKSPFYPKELLRNGSSPTPLPLAVKVQFPGVLNSITSDIRTLSFLLSGTTSLLPKGLFLDKTMEVFKQELADECNYLREAAAARRFAKELDGDSRFRVPKVIGLAEDSQSEGSRPMTTQRVLVMEMMEGTPLGAAVKWEQDVRNEIARNILTLCMKELFDFRFMQTDPNWSNFLYNRKTRQLELVDFGASREYSKEFMDRWYLLLKAAVEGDKQAGIEQSLALGYLVGGENETMIEAHLQSLILLGIPYSAKTPQPFDFSSNQIPTGVRELIPVMLQNRLTPPPRETYSLNRKLSGAFLLCGRLKASVDCRSIWEEVSSNYRVG